MLVLNTILLIFLCAPSNNGQEATDSNIDISAVCGQDRSICDPEFDEQYKPQFNQIWKNIVNQEQILNSPRNSPDLHEVQAGHYVILNSTTRSYGEMTSKSADSESGSRNPRKSTPGSSIEMMRKHFSELFMHTRNDEVSTRLKNVTRHGIIERLSHYTLETTTQEFFAKAPSGQVLQGVNIVGVIPGRNRNKPGQQIDSFSRRSLIHSSRRR